jgi:hypothetical protein
MFVRLGVVNMSMSCPERKVLLVLADAMYRSCPDMLTVEQKATLGEFLDESRHTPERQVLADPVWPHPASWDRPDD